MRYAIVSDLHANLRAWEAVWADLCSQRVEVVVCLGDVVGYGPKPAEVLRAVRAVTGNFVMGNHDAAAAGLMDYSIFNEHAREAIEWTRRVLSAEEMTFLGSVPLAIEAGEVLFVHAEVVLPGRFDYIDSVEMARENFEVGDHFVTFVGHTHLPRIYERDGAGEVRDFGDAEGVVVLEEGKRYLVNVGSVGEPRNAEDLRGRYAIYDSERRELDLRRVEFDIVGYREDLEGTDLGMRPFFLRVYEQVVEGREVRVSRGGSLVDMRVSHDSAALVDLARVSSQMGHLQGGNAGGRGRKVGWWAGIAAAVVLGVGLWWGMGKREEAEEIPVMVVAERVDEVVAEAPMAEVMEGAMKEEVEVLTEEELGEGGKMEEKGEEVVLGPELVPEEVVKEVVEVREREWVWWRMEGEGDDLVDVSGEVVLGMREAGREMKAIAPEWVPLNGERNGGARQLGVWAEEEASGDFLLGAKRSWTVEGWFLLGQVDRPIFLVGTRRVGEEGALGWHVDLRPLRGVRNGAQMSFFYASGEGFRQALAESVEVGGYVGRHFAAVWDCEKGEMRLYLDGIEVAAAEVGLGEVEIEQAGPLQVGAELNPEKLGMDELRVSFRALEPHEFLLRPAVVGVRMAGVSGRFQGSWMVGANWEGGKVPGAGDHVILGEGLSVLVKGVPERYEGVLVVEKGASLVVWEGAGVTVFPQGEKGRMILHKGTKVVVRLGERVEFGEIELLGSAEIMGGASTAGHNRQRRFGREISGSGGLALNGVNGNVFVLAAENSFRGGLRAYSSQNQKFEVEVRANGGLGKGRVVIEENGSLVIGEGLGDVIGDGEELVLEGVPGRSGKKLVLNSDERVGRWVIDGVDQGEGEFSRRTHGEVIGGNGKLVVDR